MNDNEKWEKAIALYKLGAAYIQEAAKLVDKGNEAIKEANDLLDTKKPKLKVVE